jgi:hypothetical protein
MDVPRKNAATASISSPITCLTSTLAGPVLGIFFTQPGRALKSKYGTAIPAPMAPNVDNVVAGACVAAHADAPAMKGAVQGVERTAVRMPNANEPGSDS